MGLKRVMWVRRYQGHCRALRPLGHQGYRLCNYKKDPPLCSGYIQLKAHKPIANTALPVNSVVNVGSNTPTACLLAPTLTRTAPQSQTTV